MASDDGSTGTEGTRSRRGIAALLIALLTSMGVWWALSRDETPPQAPPRPPPPAPAVPASAPPVVEPAPPPPAPPPPVAKREAPVRNEPVDVEPVPSAKGGRVPIRIDEVVGGDAKTRRTLDKAFRGGLHGVALDDQAHSGFSLTLRIDATDAANDTGTVRCSVAMARLPGRQLAGSLRTRADVQSDGATPGELLDDAADACGENLAKDVAAWAKKNAR